MDDRHQYIQSYTTVDPERQNRLRLRMLRGLAFILFSVIGLRLVQVQIIDSQRYRAIAQKQYQAKVILPADRGVIYDRHGNVLASNSALVSFAADPQLAVDDAQAIAAKFSQLFGKPRSYYNEKLHTDSRFVWLERLVDTKFLKQIDLKKLNGVVARYEPKRLYYNGSIAGQLIGCTNIDNIGISGIEQEFEQELQGECGYVVFQRDGRGRARPSVDYPRVEPVNGHSIYLTIDMQVQSIAEKELKHGVEQNHANNGMAIVLHPRTGEILALAQYPSVDPNSIRTMNVADQRLRAVTDVFEPGSVFKIVTASAALEYNLVSPEKKFYAENGVYVIPVSSSKPRKIYDTHKAGWLTFREAVEVSSNIVMAKVSDLIGSERFYKMARDYGFGIATNIDFPGEVKGTLKKPMQWSGTTLNTIAYGYEVGVTPIQIAAAYGALANNGMLMKPYLFRKETDATGTVVRESAPQQIRRVISEQTAATVRDLFEGVVERGTAVQAKISGVRIAGKTGTSKKIIEGRYEAGNYIASFIGFFPADDPKIVCLVMIDNPRGLSYYGGTTSAPVFKAIAEQIINTTDLVIPPSKTFIASVPSSSVDRDTLPSPSQEKNCVPDVRGLSVRRAVSLLKEKKIIPVVNGTGLVIGQIPAAGAVLRRGMVVTLSCGPRSMESIGMN
jgi:cell division protein FtsI (penicillin-binding protein 3)